MRRVLVIHHHPLVLDALVDLISEAPHLELVGTVTNPEQAVTVARSTRPDIVLINMDMPNFDGNRLIFSIGGFLPYARIVPMSVLRDPKSVILEDLY